MIPKNHPQQRLLFIIALAAVIILIIPVWFLGWRKNLQQNLHKQAKNENLEQKHKQMENLKTELENLKNAWNNGLMDLEKQIDGLDDVKQNNDQLEEKLKLPE